MGVQMIAAHHPLPILHRRIEVLEYVMKCYIFLSIAIAASLLSAPAHAEQQTAPKTEQVVCATQTACDKLVASLEAQAAPLEAKGMENLTEKEFNEYDKLTDKILAVQKARLAEAKAKTAAQEKKIAEQKAQLAALKEVSTTLGKIEAALSTEKKPQ